MDRRQLQGLDQPADAVNGPVSAWTPASWRALPAAQQPVYDDPALCAAVLQQLAAMPPLVFVGEVDQLTRMIAAAGRGEAFVLQGGNCAERFCDCQAQSIADQLKVLLQMSVILAYGTRRPIVRIGRIAGQYAKPRSQTTETVGGRQLPVYRGDIVNSFEPTTDGRRPDPERLREAYWHAAVTLNYIRAMIDGGFADLHYPSNWNLSGIEGTPKWADYQETVDHILDAISFMEAFGGVRNESLGRVDMYTSHEGLLLGYEEALTHVDDGGNHYNLGAHMLWIGDRTRDLDGAHVEYFRGLRNPIGIKIGPSCEAADLPALLARLNPDNRPGRVTLITRLGADRVGELLPPSIAAVRDAGATVTWSCDPMHGNTGVAEGRKTRSFDAILRELEQTFRVHEASDSRLGGVHFELTADDVTECTGGAMELTDRDLARRYDTWCDPRLNGAQSLEVAFLIARMLQSDQSTATRPNRD